MAVRAKYKPGVIVEFTFAGSTRTGEIIEVRKEGNKVSYLIEKENWKYPVQQDKITKKL